MRLRYPVTPDDPLTSPAPRTRSQLHCLQDFRDYGLVYQPQRSSRSGPPSYFYPTRLATTLTSTAASTTATTTSTTSLTSSTGSDESEERGFIILETNYRLYAYTSNPLRIAVLQLFTHVRSRFPNLIIGVITRESIKAALAKGISAEQVIAYLSHHAHPQMYRNVSGGEHRQAARRTAC